VILPTKRLPEERSLIRIGGEVVGLLDENKTVSRLWDEFKSARKDRGTTITFDWFVLALDLLFMMGIVVAERGLLRRVES
jgi:hypothetical protein